MAASAVILVLTRSTSCVPRSVCYNPISVPSRHAWVMNSSPVRASLIVQVNPSQAQLGRLCEGGDCVGHAARCQTNRFFFYYNALYHIVSTLPYHAWKYSQIEPRTKTKKKRFIMEGQKFEGTRGMVTKDEETKMCPVK